MLRLHYLQHVPFEGLGSIESWAIARACPITVTRLYANDAFPPLADFDLLVVLGGPMGVDETDTYPWLTAEKHFIKTAIHDEKSVLGICLGSQVVADVLGARVYRNAHEEIGWFPVRINPEVCQTSLLNHLPPQVTLFHWHGDTFDLPEQAIRLGSSEVCLNQGFSWQDRVLGLQFHLEATPDSVSAMLREEPYQPSMYTQSPEAIMAYNEGFTTSRTLMEGILDRLDKRYP
jgi:GMP synthase-like glutamine amidotransferase